MPDINDSIFDNNSKSNLSLQDFFSILQSYKPEGGNQNNFTPTTEIFFLVANILVIVGGVVGNMMVIYVIWRKKVLRTPRNLYIINLAISDLSMCVFCMPLTLVQLLHVNFPFGDFICKLMQVVQCSNIIVSICTIVAIAADRYTAIVVGLSERSHGYVCRTLVIIWVTSVGFAVPLYCWYGIESVSLPATNFHLYNKCVSKWPSKNVMYAHMIVLSSVMYVIPITVVSSVHFSIKKYLDQHSMDLPDSRRAHRERERNRKTTFLLSAIAIVFAISWLPYTSVNLIADFNHDILPENPQTFYLIYSSCLLLAMSTSCSNPILYGWLNTNLRRELLEILPAFVRKPKVARWKCSMEVNCRHEPEESHTRNGESVTYSTVILQARLSPRCSSLNSSSSPLLITPIGSSSTNRKFSNDEQQSIVLSTKPDGCVSKLLQSNDRTPDFCKEEEVSENEGTAV